MWAFWIACGLTALGAVLPLVLGEGNRIGVVYPYLGAALALGACALVFRQGRSVTTVLFFFAGLAIVYGILWVIWLQLRLAVIGTCPPQPAACGPGLERPLTDAETTSLWFVAGMGVVGLMTGYFGLRTLYRRLAAYVPPLIPPARRIDPVAESAPPRPEPAASPQPITPEPEAKIEELPAPAEPLELPPPTREEAPESNISAPSPKPRWRRTPKATPDAPTTPTNLDS
jgi:hypothetical protein